MKAVFERHLSGPARGWRVGCPSGIKLRLMSVLSIDPRITCRDRPGVTSRRLLNYSDSPCIMGQRNDGCVG